MITVSILINGQPIYTRSAVNRGVADSKKHTYEVDDGTILFHDRKEGAIKLAHLLLDTIKEQK